MRPGRLKEGSSAVLEWVVGCRCQSENFGWLSVASFISVLLARCHLDQCLLPIQFEAMNEVFVDSFHIYIDGDVNAR